MALPDKHPGNKTVETTAPLRQRTWPKKTRVEDDGEGNWLVSYADMMTLLFGFFVMLTAFSKPDAGKLEKIIEATAQQMGKKYVNPYEDLSNELKGILEQSQLTDQVELKTTEDGIAIVSKGTLFFDSGSTNLKEMALDLTRKIAVALTERAANNSFQVTVEGHTDDVPIVSKQFPSNWELSANRASTVVRLFESVGFKHSSLRPVGLADTEPVVPNRDSLGQPIPDNQSLNRRIVIRILNKRLVGDASRANLPESGANSLKAPLQKH